VCVCVGAYERFIFYSYEIFVVALRLVVFGEDERIIIIRRRKKKN